MTITTYKIIESKKQYLSNCVEHILWASEKIDKGNLREDAKEIQVREMRNSIHSIRKHADELEKIVNNFSPAK